MINLKTQCPCLVAMPRCTGFFVVEADAKTATLNDSSMIGSRLAHVSTWRSTLSAMFQAREASFVEVHGVRLSLSDCEGGWHRASGCSADENGGGSIFCRE